MYFKAQIQARILLANSIALFFFFFSYGMELLFYIRAMVTAFAD